MEMKYKFANMRFTPKYYRRQIKRTAQINKFAFIGIRNCRTEEGLHEGVPSSEVTGFTVAKSYSHAT